MADSKGNCFIITPISTPEAYLESYRNDKKHFHHVLEYLLVPAVEKAGFIPIRPISEGSDIIQADIIRNLAEANHVLCDMSTLNPNVFYELGIRTALDKPVALIADDRLEKMPFDTSLLNCMTYSGNLDHWKMDKEITILSGHISDAFEKSNGRNSMWKYFGVAQVGHFDPNTGTPEEKMDLILRELNVIRVEQNKTTNQKTYKKPPFKPVLSDGSNFSPEQIYSLTETMAYFAAVQDGYSEDPDVYWKKAEKTAKLIVKSYLGLDTARKTLGNSVED